MGIFVLKLVYFTASMALFIVYFTKKIVKFLKRKGIIGAIVSDVPMKQYNPSEHEEEED